ncbi:MAG: putative sulfate/molybdate transporter [Actinomycetes bacterium]|nr:putative sulfate/molybdate transporter [Actinomycetes bacterium]
MDSPRPATRASGPLAGFAFDRREWSGAVADLGVLVPITVALIVSNGLAPTAVLLPPALLYLLSALRYRLPVPVQPLKAFGAIAIALGLGVDEIAAGAVMMGVIFVFLGMTGLLDRVALIFPRSVIRGVQIAVGLLFLKVAWGLVADPPPSFQVPDVSTWWLVAVGLLVGVVAWKGRRHGVGLLVVVVGLIVAVVTGWSDLALGPSDVPLPAFSIEAFVAASTALVLPQVPLTFANSCLAPADAARVYFGEEAARRVTPSRLAASLGVADLFAGAIGGMPVCHGAGGMTAHRSFGARTGGAPFIMGSVLLVLALALGSGLAGVLSNFPVSVLAGLLAVAGLLHLALSRDLRARGDWVVAVIVGVLGVVGQLALGLVIGLVLAWVFGRLDRTVDAPRRS